MRKFRRLGLEVLEGRVLLHGETGSGVLNPDVNGDGRVDVFDLNLVSTWWDTSGPVGDANGDQRVDAFDIGYISARFTNELAHSTDAVKRVEHEQLLALVSRGDATAVAIESGPWSDSETWLYGILPTDDAKVWIPQGVSVAVDRVISDRIAWIRVDGTLSFAHDRDTRLAADTIIGGPTGHLEINTGSGFTTTIVFVDRGPIDTVWDPFALSRGMVWHGSAANHGAEKAPYSFATGALAPGQRQIPVADASGWQVGDKLVIAGTALDHRLDQDDVRHIAAIIGNSVSGYTVTLDTPLTYSHVLVDGHPPVIENRTRNVTFRSENTQDNQRAGHVMLMHNPNVAVAYAAFEGLGRTDKTRGITTPDGLGGGLENPLARYALHFHRTGFETPIAVTGVAIDGSPGWGLVNHESYVNARYNVSYNVVGTHYVTETGNEIGEFVGNVAVRSHGDTLRNGNDKFRDGMRDFGIGGDGFWLESPFVRVQDNIAIGLSGTGMFFFPGEDFADMRDAGHAYFVGADGSPINMRQYVADNFQALNVQGLAFWRPNFPGATPGAGGDYWADFHQAFAVAHIPFGAEGNLVYGAQFSLVTWAYSSFNGLQAQLTGNTLIGPVFMGYSHNLRFADNRVIAPDYTASAFGVGHTGVNSNMTYENNTVTGFVVGIEMPTENAFGENTLTGGYYDNLETDILILNTQPGRYRTIEIVNPNFGSRAENHVNMEIGFFTYNINALYPRIRSDDIHEIDTLFTTSALGHPDSRVHYNGQSLYYSEQAADFRYGELLTHAPAYWTQAQKDQFEDLRRNDDGAFATTADLAAEGLIVGGLPLPLGEQYRLPGIRGVFVRGSA